MPAVITDQIRVLNATNFVSGISTTDNSYYVFIGLPNATSVASDWNTSTPSPIDNFDEHDNLETHNCAHARMAVYHRDEVDARILGLPLASRIGGVLPKHATKERKASAGDLLLEMLVQGAQ